MHIKYPKIHRLGKEETGGICVGVCYIQEKIDGANASIWLEDGEIHTGSRNRDVTNESFNGFTEYVKNHLGINQILNDHPNFRLYGEWLVRHTVHYDETAYKQFYLFDIVAEEEEGFISQEAVYGYADDYKIHTPHMFGKYLNPTLEQLKEFCGESRLGKVGEGIVIKNMDFVNKFGDKQYAKLVTENFMESNAIVFGGNNKFSKVYAEMGITNKYMTLARVEKVMNKIQPYIEERLDKEHTGRIIQTAYHDLITEEIWAIQKKWSVINFKQLSRLAQRKAAQIYHDILAKSISVADQYETHQVGDGPVGEIIK